MADTIFLLNFSHFPVLDLRCTMPLANVRAGGIDGSDMCRRQWSHGLRAAATGCRRRQECKEQCACECDLRASLVVLEGGDDE